jgi:mRNA-degrading endonuclease RelE of RelBE toxin-antitoxin system
MAYKVSYRSSFRHDFKKLSDIVQDIIINLADRIQKGTLEGEKLKGNFKSFHKLPFGHRPEYRLVYKIYDCRIENDGDIKCMFEDIEHTLEELQSCDGLIEFVLIKTREEMNNLYAQPKNYIKKLSR